MPQNRAFPLDPLAGRVELLDLTSHTMTAMDATRITADSGLDDDDADMDDLDADDAEIEEDDLDLDEDISKGLDDDDDDDLGFSGLDDDF